MKRKKNIIALCQRKIYTDKRLEIGDSLKVVHKNTFIL